MPRSSNAASSADEASGDGGIGRGNGMTSEIDDRSRMPRARSSSSSSSAVSLGAGGHLNGPAVMPMTTSPPPNSASVRCSAKAPASL